MTLIRSQQPDVVSRLATLGLSEAELAQAVTRGLLARSECTPNHPPLHAGFVTWSNTVCALREILLLKGWERSDEGNYSVVIHPSRSFAIAVATGDENTGNPNANPMTKSPKGPSTRSAVAVNLSQAWLFSELMPVLPEHGQPANVRSIPELLADVDVIPDGASSRRLAACRAVLSRVGLRARNALDDTTLVVSSVVCRWLRHASLLVACGRRVGEATARKPSMDIGQ